MKILTAEQIRAADQYTIQNEPIMSIDLMERASEVFAKWFMELYPTTRTVDIYCGMGNNGGDGLAVARMLDQEGYGVTVYKCRYSEHTSEDFSINEERLRSHPDVKQVDVRSGGEFPRLDDVIIDALWGSGLSRPIEGYWADLIGHLNDAPCEKIALDIPSGLYADKQADGVIFTANRTLTFDSPKLSFMLPQNAPYLGDWEHQSIGLDTSFLDGQKDIPQYVTDNLASRTYQPRSKFSHKGTHGHALMIAGSYGKMGAAVLAAKACLRAGAGLVTTYIPKCGYEIMQTALPEVMAMTDVGYECIQNLPTLDKYDVIGVGPGLGTEDETAAVLVELLDKIDSSKQSLVLDADALNIISRNKELLNKLPQRTTLTPHPKEFTRLFGTTANEFERLELLKDMAQQYKTNIVLKGAHTAIASASGELYFNSTGNPGMATAGSGDVLTGIATALMGQGYQAIEASYLAVYLHGLAGDVAAEIRSQESLIAGDIIEHLGDAFQIIKESPLQS